MAYKARLVDVAKSAGVSTATVSFVLAGNRKGRTNPASEETVRRVREAADRLGYVPNRHAQAIRRGYSSAVVLALGSPEDPWNAQVCIEVQRRALTHGLSTVSLVDETWYDFLRGFSPAVSFITSTDFVHDGLERVATLAEQGGAMVVFSTRADPDAFDVISSSPVDATIDAYNRLRTRHDHVHLLSSLRPDALRPGPTRTSAFRTAVSDAGDGGFHELMQFAGVNRADMPAACHELLDRGATAVICSTGYLAHILRDIAISRGLRLPDDLEIIAIGDIPHNGDSYLGPISTYGTPHVFERIANIVVDRAVHQHAAPFERHEFAWEYVPGATTRADG